MHFDIFDTKGYNIIVNGNNMISRTGNWHISLTKTMIRY